MFEYAREHGYASGLLNHQNPLLPELLSIDLEQEITRNGSKRSNVGSTDRTPICKYSMKKPANHPNEYTCDDRIRHRDDGGFDG